MTLMKHGVDCFSTIAPGQPEQLAALGYTFFARYYRRAPLEGGKGNAVSRAEMARLFAAGFWSLAIYQNASNKALYFTEEEGRKDAAAALAAAAHHGQPRDTTIYFAVDYDATGLDLPYIVAYFRVIKDLLWTAGYFTGAYGSGLVLRTLSNEGLVHRTWLANAKGWRGYAEWFPHADVRQTTLPFTLPFGLQVDANVVANHLQAGFWRPDMGQDPTAPVPAPTAAQRSLMERIGLAISRIFGRNPGGPRG